jgi:hypothetical protein
MKPLILLTALIAGTAVAADLPVRQVILYKHGVGFFERSGQLAPGESARLDFKTSEMDDVLKSLVIEERGGGAIAGLRYDSSEPLARKLAEFPFHVDGSQPLSAILDQLKGARVEMVFGNETVAGAMVSGRVARGDDKRPEREQITLMLDTGDLRTFDLSAATSLRFPDAKLQALFRDYLAALTGARSKDKRTVYIDSTSAKGREIVAGYMIPMPVWKSSYRLIFGNTGQPVLEGWAIVDNTTGEDWANVQLSLVSGRPVSFISRLYEPKYITRPGAELPEEIAQRPVVYEGALDARRDEAKKAVAGIVGGYLGARAANEQAAMAAPAPRQFNVPSTVMATAATREMGDLFEYRIPATVTVRRNESAMLPFLQQKLDTRKLLIYSDPGSAHPMNAAELSNSTGKTLDGGPITVYDGGAYAGEALVETVKTGDKRLISYAVDLGTRITTAFDSKAEIVREVHFRRGILTARMAAQETRTYTIHNVDQKPKTLIIEHPARPQYKLLDLKPAEKTTNAYRFEVKLAPGATEKFPVSEERVYDNTIAYTNLTPDLLTSYIQNKSLSEPVRKQLEQIAAKKRQIAANDSELRKTDAQINDLVQDQDRIRRNISSLNQVSGQQQQVQNYARQLAAQEGQLATLRDRQAELQKRKAALEAELNSSIETISF